MPRQTLMKIIRAALVVPALVLIAACGASDQSDSTAQAPMLAERDGGALTEPVAPPGAPAPAGGTAQGSDRNQSGGAKVATTPTQTRSVISKGQISLESEDLDKARFELQKLLGTWDGVISNEESSADDEGRTDRQRLEVRVPADKFGPAMDAISTLGTLVDRSRTSEDVTTQVIDNNTRVKSQKLSLARVQALLAQAKDLDQIIAIESQLSQRQAELDSLEQQQSYLADQSAQSTITVYLSTPGEDEAPTEEKDDDGFFAGLSAGWDGLTSVTGGLLEGLGATLPFAVVIALIGVPVWTLRRRLRALT